MGKPGEKKTEAPKQSGQDRTLAFGNAELTFREYEFVPSAGEKGEGPKRLIRLPSRVPDEEERKQAEARERFMKNFRFLNSPEDAENYIREREALKKREEEAVAGGKIRYYQKNYWMRDVRRAEDNFEYWLKNQAGEEMRLFRDAALRKFPFPAAVFHGQSGEVTGNGEPVVLFTRADRERLETLKNSRRTTLSGAEKAPSEPMRQIRDALSELDRLFPEGEEQTLWNSREEMEAKTAEIGAALQSLKTRCRTYLDARRGFRWTPTGRQRKALVTRSLELAEQKLALLNELAERTRKQDCDLAEKRAEETDRQFRARMEERRQSAYERAAEEKDVSRRDEISLVPYLGLSEEQKYDMTCARLASLYCEPRHNPYRGIHEEPGRTKAEKEAFAADERNRTNGYTGYLTFCAGVGKQVRTTYSPDALISIANLQILDTAMHDEVKERDFYVKYRFYDAAHRELELDAADQAAFDAAIKSGKISYCLITDVLAKPLRGGMFREGKFSQSFSGLTSSGFVPRETLNRILAVDQKTLDRKLQSVMVEKETKVRVPAKKYGEEPGEKRVVTPDYDKSKLLRGKVSAELKKFRETAARAGENVSVSYEVLSADQLRRKIANRSFTLQGYGKEPYFKKDLLDRIGIQRAGGEQRILRQVTRTLDTDTLTLLGEDRIPAGLSAMMADPKRYGADRELTAVLVSIREMAKLPVGSAFDFQPKAFTLENGTARPLKDGETEDSPGYDDAIRDMSLYDLKASRLYERVGKYLAGHAGELADPKSPASLLEKWRDERFPGSGAEYAPFRVPEGRLIDAAAGAGEPESERAFDGDRYQLFAANVFGQSRFLRENEKRPENGEQPLSDPRVYLKDFTGAPLFTRDPDVSDVKQTELGNCWFLAGAASMADREKGRAIKDMMRDNGDGTVTCRFMDPADHAPVFVRVTKKIPYYRDSGMPEGYDRKVSGERSPLWVQLLQKAYTLSGLKKRDAKRDAEEFIDDFGTFCGVAFKGENDPKFVELLNEKFGETAPGQNAAADLKKIYERGLYNLHAGGHVRNLLAHCKGTLPRQRQISGFREPREILKVLKDQRRKGRLFDNELFGSMPAFSAEEETIGLKILEIAGGNLAAEKLHNGLDKQGNRFIYCDHIYLEDLTDAILHAYERSAGYLMRGFENKKQEFDSVAERLNAQLLRGQKYSLGGVTRVPVREQKEYTAYELSLFHELRRRLDGGRSIGCTFRNVTGERSDRNTMLGLDLSGGLALNHAFSILSVRKDPTDRKLYVRLRNPWASGEQTKVTVKVAGEAVELSSLNPGHFEARAGNGVFEMEFRDFVNKARDYDYERPPLTREDVAEYIANRYLSLAQQMKPEEFSGVLQKADPAALFDRVLRSETVQKLSETYFREKGTMETLEADKDIRAERIIRDTGLEKDVARYAEQQKEKAREAEAQRQNDAQAEKGGVHA